MSCLVTQPAPDFTAEAVLPDGSFGEVRLSDLKGKYVVLFFYPLDFTFVCPTEILAFDKKLDEFKKRGCELIGISVDSKYSHWAWRNTPPKEGGIGQVGYPLVADLTKDISRSYGILFDNAVALRALFLIDRSGIVRHELVFDLPLGRSVDEAIRALDALIHFEKHGEVCPANWKPGEEAMNGSAEGVAGYLAKHAE